MKPKNPITVLIGWLALAVTPAHTMHPADTTSGNAVSQAGGSAGQVSLGTIRGRVSNQATGDLLPGAQIQVEGTNLSATSERDGSFQINAPVGNQVLHVSFTGLDSQQVPVAVGAGQTAVQNIELTSQTYVLDKFTVAGMREGTALAIQQQRLAPNLMNVAAIDTFGSPAANPGDLIQRLPGVVIGIAGGEARTLSVRGMDPTFSTVLIDGNRQGSTGGPSQTRENTIELMGSSDIESVELIKAATPDMDGGATGGAVNLVTKRAFNLPGRRIAYSIGTIWKVREGSEKGTHETDSPSPDLFSFNYSDVFSVFGGKNNLGITANVLFRHATGLLDRIQHTRNFTGVTQPTSPVLRTGISFQEYSYPYDHYTGGIGLDYKLSEDAFVYIRFSANRRQQFQEYHYANWTGGTATANYEPGWTTDYLKALPVASSVFQTNAWHNYRMSYNSNINAGGEVKLPGDIKLSYSGFYSYAATTYPGRDQGQIVAEVRGVGVEFDARNTDTWYPRFTQYAGPDLYDPNNYRLTSLTFSGTGRGTNMVDGARIDLRKNFEVGVPAWVKIGAKIGQEDRGFEQTQSRYTFVGRDGIAFTADDAASPYMDQGYTYKPVGGRYGPFPSLQFPHSGESGDIYKTLISNPEWWVKDVAFSAPGERGYLNNNVTETVTAGYVEGNVQLGRLRILAGLRVEKTETKGTAWEHILTAAEAARRRAFVGPVTPEETIRRVQAEYPGQVTNRGNYKNVFPGVHFVYEPRDGLLVLASYNLSITRPNIGQMLPSINVQEDAQTIAIGNPNLKPYTGNNFELSLQKYFEPVGHFGVGVFLKELSNYSRNTVSIISAGPDNGFQGQYAGWQLTQPFNTGSARIRGVEVDYQQQLSFLPGFWKGFGLFANHVWLQAQGSFSGTAFTNRLGGMVPRVANGGISYSYHGFQGRIMGNYRSRYYTGGTWPSALWQDPRLFTDVKVQYAITRNLDIFCDISNVFNEPTSMAVYEVGPNQYLHRHGTNYTVGIRGKY